MSGLGEGGVSGSFLFVLLRIHVLSITMVVNISDLENDIKTWMNFEAKIWKHCLITHLLFDCSFELVVTSRPA